LKVKDGHKCPVCGYALEFEPWKGSSASDEICPCCAIQFGYDDAAGKSTSERQPIYEKWRVSWIESGMPWKGASDKPSGWDPHKQLRSLLKPTLSGK
jgi:hypothetical protein